MEIMNKIIKTITIPIKGWMLLLKDAGWEFKGGMYTTNIRKIKKMKNKKEGLFLKPKSLRNLIDLLLEENKESMIAVMDRIPMDDPLRIPWMKNTIRSNNEEILKLVFSKQAIDERTSGFARTMKEKEPKRYGEQ